MPTLSALLRNPTLRDALVAINAPAGDPAVEQLFFADELSALDAAPRDSLVLATESACHALRDFELDVALRRAGQREVQAIVLSGSTLDALPMTADALAGRAGLHVLRTSGAHDFSTVALTLQREIAGSADTVVARGAAALEALVAAAERGEQLDVQLARAANELEMPLSLGEPADEDLSAAVVVDGHEITWLCAPRSLALHLVAAQVALEALAGCCSRALARELHEAEAPVQSRADVLTELLIAEPHATDGVVRRARAMAVPIDGWHTAVRIEPSNLLSITANEVQAFELGRSIARMATEVARGSGHDWHRAGTGGTLILFETRRHDAGQSGRAEVEAVVGRVLARLRASHPELVLHCGIGTIHPGPAGLRASAEEARAAAGLARTSGRDQPVSFDAVGLRRILVEWYASDSAREAVRALLKRLDALGPRKAEETVRTLQVYLDTGGSLQRAAATLHVHRNTVRYRVLRALELLEIDLDDPEERLMLQLACRARSLDHL